MQESTTTIVAFDQHADMRRGAPTTFNGVSYLLEHHRALGFLLIPRRRVPTGSTNACECSR